MLITRTCLNKIKKKKQRKKNNYKYSIGIHLYINNLYKETFFVYKQILTFTGKFSLHQNVDKCIWYIEIFTT